MASIKNPKALPFAVFPLITFGLGTWQMQRLQWKEKLLQEIKEERNLPPLHLEEIDDLGTVGQFRRVYITGHYAGPHTLVGPTSIEAQGGYILTQSFATRIGKITVCRGLIPAAQAKTGLEQFVDNTERGVRVTGWLVTEDSDRTTWTPPNTPSKDEFFSADPKALGEKLGTKKEYLIKATLERSPNKDIVLPATPIYYPEDLEKQIPNNHLVYVFTWYPLTVALSVATWWLLKRPPTPSARSKLMK